MVAFKVVHCRSPLAQSAAAYVAANVTGVAASFNCQRFYFFILKLKNIF
jgi:hypothetical protein